MAGEQVRRAGASGTVPFPRSPPQARPWRSDGREAGRRVCQRLGRGSPASTPGEGRPPVSRPRSLQQPGRRRLRPRLLGRSER